MDNSYNSDMTFTQWKSGVEASPVKITVSDYQKQKQTLSSITTYAVTTYVDGREDGVRRRYSDFEALHESLSGRYLGMLVPPLPGKKLFGASEDNFVIRRMRGLQIFCEQVAMNPYLRKDNVMESFLTMDPVSWESAKKVAKRTSASKCEGEMRWSQAIEQCQIPIDIEAKVARIKQEIVILEKFIKVALESTQKLQEASQNYSSGIAQLHTSLQNWEEAELNEIRVLNEHSSMAKMLRNTCRMLGNEKELAAEQPGVVDNLMMAVATYELGQIRIVMAMLSKRDSLEPQLNSARQKVSNLQNTPDAQDKLQQAQLSLQEKQQAFDSVTKGMIVLEMERFATTRALNIKNMMGHYAAMISSMSARRQQIAADYFADMAIEGNEMLESGSKILEALALNPLPRADLSAVAGSVAPIDPAYEDLASGGDNNALSNGIAQSPAANPFETQPAPVDVYGGEKSNQSLPLAQAVDAPPALPPATSGEVRARVDYEFQGTQEGDLDLTKDAIIIVTKQEEGGWWEGYNEATGAKGSFPGNYVQTI